RIHIRRHLPEPALVKPECLVDDDDPRTRLERFSGAGHRFERRKHRGPDPVELPSQLHVRIERVPRLLRGCRPGRLLVSEPGKRPGLGPGLCGVRGGRDAERRVRLRRPDLGSVAANLVAGEHVNRIRFRLVSGDSLGWSAQNLTLHPITDGLLNPAVPVDNFSETAAYQAWWGVTNLPASKLLVSISTKQSDSSSPTVTFSASGSGGHRPYNFTWPFGDGTFGTGSSPTHTYPG